MKPEPRGKVFVNAKIDNLFDIESAERGLLPADQVRSIKVVDATVGLPRNPPRRGKRKAE